MTTSPAYKLRIGTLQATIWRNLSDKNNWYSVKLTRSYKVDDGWRETDNLGADDLLGFRYGPILRTGGLHHV